MGRVKSSFLVEAQENAAFNGPITTPQTALDVITGKGIARPWVVTTTAWTHNVLAPDRGAGCSCRMLVTLGGDVGAEQVLVDVPLQGAAWVTTAQRVRADILWTVDQNTTGKMPSVQGWIAPVGGGYGGIIGPPTLTEEPLVALNVNQGKPYNIPPRARAFRVFSTMGDDDSIGVMQLDGKAVGVAQDFVFLQELAGHQWTAANRSRWFPVHPRAASMVLTPNVIGINGITVQWQLEL